MTSDNFWWFLTYLPKYHVRQFLPYNVRFLGVILDLPTLKSDVNNGRSLISQSDFQFSLQIFANFWNSEESFLEWIL